MSRDVSIVVVPSTFCNLRCAYCYELPLLADKTRIGGDDLVTMFEHLALFFRDQKIDNARIVWHGGEPLLLPPEYFWKAFEIQKRACAGVDTNVTHVTQTNLTVLDEERMTLIRDGFAYVGVSLDMFGSLRVNAGGDCKEHLALANLERLRARGIPLTGITVLTKGNRRFVRDIYEFYAERSMTFRLLPLYRGDYAAGQWFEITSQDTLRAYCTLADLWLENPLGPGIHPVTHIIRQVYEALEGRQTPLFDKRSFERLLFIDRDGLVYPYSDKRGEDRAYGNIFREPLRAMLTSAVHEKIMVETEARIEKICGSCPHLGKSCSGSYAAEQTFDFWDQEPDGGVRCTAYRGLIDHIQRRLEDNGVGRTSETAVRATP